MVLDMDSGALKRSASPQRTALKYRKYSSDPDSLEEGSTKASPQPNHRHQRGVVISASRSQKLPSQMLAELSNPATRHAERWRPRPRIIELLNLADYTHQVCIQGSLYPFSMPSDATCWLRSSATCRWTSPSSSRSRQRCCSMDTSRLRPTRPRSAFETMTRWARRNAHALPCKGLTNP